MHACTTSIHTYIRRSQEKLETSKHQNAGGCGFRGIPECRVPLFFWPAGLVSRKDHPVTDRSINKKLCMHTYVRVYARRGDTTVRIYAQTFLTPSLPPLAKNKNTQRTVLVIRASSACCCCTRGRRHHHQQQLTALIGCNNKKQNPQKKNRKKRVGYLYNPKKVAAFARRRAMSSVFLAWARRSKLLGM